MDFILTLAHFCEIHGPTSVFCTQISPVSCATCQPCHTPPSDAPPKSPSSYPAAQCDAPHALTPGGGYAHHRGPSLSSPFESPPSSPQASIGSHNPYFPSVPENNAARRFSESIDMNGTDACDNCTFLVPNDVTSRLPDGAPGSPVKDGKGKNGSPVLRTLHTVLAPGTSTPPDSDSEGSDSAYSPTQSHSTSTLPPSFGSTPATSPLYPPQFPPPNTHTHTLTYLSTQQAASPSAYSAVRRACIRTLSCENLPRGSRSGPLYFGDPIAGNTIAYVFRLPDPRARGRCRTYALIALGGQDGRRVSRAMVRITEVFEAIAGRIVSLADQVLEKEEAARQFQYRTSSVPTTPLSSSAGSSVAVMSPLQSSFQEKNISRPQSSSANSPSPVKSRNITPVSSFLSAKQVDPDGYPRFSRELRAKGLADIVGNDNFFVWLHAQFCMLLSLLEGGFGS